MSGSFDYGNGTLPVTVDPTCWYGRFFNPVASNDGGALFTQITTQITASLATAGHADIAVYAWPNYDLDDWWAGDSAAFVLLAYTGSKLSPPISTNAMFQQKTLEFSVFVLARQTAWADFTSAASPFVLIQAIEQGLSGFQPTGCRPLHFTEQRYSEQDPEGRIWLYKMTLNVVTYLTMQMPPQRLANLASLHFLVTPPATQATTVYTVANGIITLPANFVVSAVTDAITGALYQPGPDYIVDDLAGVLTANPTGALSNGVKVMVSSAPVMDTLTVP